MKPKAPQRLSVFVFYVQTVHRIFHTHWSICSDELLRYLTRGCISLFCSHFHHPLATGAESEPNTRQINENKKAGARCSRRRGDPCRLVSWKCGGGRGAVRAIKAACVCVYVCVCVRAERLGEDCISQLAGAHHTYRDPQTDTRSAAMSEVGASFRMEKRLFCSELSSSITATG